MKRKTTTIILVIIFLIGFSVLLYPVVSSYVNQMDATKATEQYDELMKKMENKKSESILNEPSVEQSLTRISSISERVWLTRLLKLSTRVGSEL